MIENDISLNQSHYIEKILKKFDSFDVDPVKTPYDAGVHLVKIKDVPICQMEYPNIISSVMFLMIPTRLDIAHAQSRLSIYTHNLIDNH